MAKKIPQRMCVACRSMKNKSDLLRVAKSSDGTIFVDLTLKASGRGAYVCKDANCFEKLKKTKALNRVFKCEVNQEILDQLKNFIGDVSFERK